MIEKIKTQIKKKLPKSVKKYIARQKSQIRNTFSDQIDIDEKITELYSRVPRYD